MKDFKKFLKEEENKYSYSGGYYSNNPMYAGYKYTFEPASKQALININGGDANFEECGAHPDTYGDECSVFFYEFSAIDRGCKHFVSKKAFFQWIEECNIEMEDSFRRELNFRGTVWVACIPYCNKAILKRYRSALVNFLEKHKNGEEVTDSEKNVYS